MGKVKQIFVMDKGFFKDEKDKNHIPLNEAELLVNNVKLSFEWKQFTRGNWDAWGFLVRIETEGDVRLYNKILDKVTEPSEEE